MKETAADWLESLRITGKPDEWESKKLLNMFGLGTELGKRILPGDSVDPGDLVFPLVMKVCDPDILHKNRARRSDFECIGRGFHRFIQPA